MKRIHYLAVFAVAMMVSSAAFARAQLLQPESVEKYWTVTSTGEPSMPSYGKNLTAPTCAAVSYLIQAGGTTSHVKLEKIVPEGDLDKVAVSIVQNLHFTATKQNIGKDSVYTYRVVLFNAPEATPGPNGIAAKQQLLDRCKLEDLKLPADV